MHCPLVCLISYPFLWHLGKFFILVAFVYCLCVCLLYVRIHTHMYICMCDWHICVEVRRKPVGVSFSYQVDPRLSSKHLYWNEPSWLPKKILREFIGSPLSSTNPKVKNASRLIWSLRQRVPHFAVTNYLVLLLASLCVCVNCHLNAKTKLLWWGQEDL